MKPALDNNDLAKKIKAWGRDLGFQQVGISDIDLTDHGAHLAQWLARGFHGEMDYMQRHGEKRHRPELLVPGTARVISVRMDYRIDGLKDYADVLDQPETGAVSRYALGRDYHKVLRQRLQALCDRIQAAVGAFGHRVFVDSAPVLEKALAEKAGLGWIGKHSNLINKRAGSWFFLGEIYTDLELPPDPPATFHCGSCTRCLQACPTDAIVAPFQVDARKCISYLTIELHGPIPEALRRPMGNRIYGCDDCQMVCPWNKFSQPSGEVDFQPRNDLDEPALLDLFAWDEDEFLRRTAGSPIRRIGHTRWLRNIAVALGNCPGSEAVLTALQDRLPAADALLTEHLHWAIAEQLSKLALAGAS